MEENQNIISVRLRSGQCAFLVFAFLVGFHGISHIPAKNIKTRIPMHFWVP